MERTDSTLVTEIKTTNVPTSGQTVSGYGGKIPTRYMIKYAGRWHRVYSMAYGNSATPYIRKGGRVLVMDSETQQRLSN